MEAQIVLVLYSKLGYNNLIMIKYITLIFVATTVLTGCGHFVKTENIYVDNSAVNNYVGNPCAFTLNDSCLFLKGIVVSPRNPNNPYGSSSK